MKSGGRVLWRHDSNNPLRAQVVSHEGYAQKTSHLLGGCIWEKSGQCGGIARARYAPSAIQDDGVCSRYFCIHDPAPQHEWQGHDSGVFKQLIEWMEGSLLHGIEHPKDSPTRHQTIVCFGPKIMGGGSLPASMLTSTLFIHGLGQNSTNSPSSQPLFAKDSFCSSGCKQNRDFVRAQGASSRRPRQRLSMTFQNASYALTSQSVHPRC